MVHQCWFTKLTIMVTGDLSCEWESESLWCGRGSVCGLWFVVRGGCET